MTGNSSLHDQVVRVFSTVLKREFASEMDIVRSETPQWDSLKHIELLFAIEDHFELQFSEEQLATLDRLSTIITAIEVERAA